MPPAVRAAMAKRGNQESHLTIDPTACRIVTISNRQRAKPRPGHRFRLAVALGAGVSVEHFVRGHDAVPCNQDVVGRGILRSEYGREVPPARLKEDSLVLLLDAHQLSQRLEALALSACRVTRQLVEIGTRE